MLRSGSPPLARCSLASVRSAFLLPILHLSRLFPFVCLATLSLLICFGLSRSGSCTTSTAQVRFATFAFARCCFEQRSTLLSCQPALLLLFFDLLQVQLRRALVITSKKTSNHSKQSHSGPSHHHIHFESLDSSHPCSIVHGSSSRPTSNLSFAWRFCSPVFCFLHCSQLHSAPYLPRPQLGGRGGGGGISDNLKLTSLAFHGRVGQADCLPFGPACTRTDPPMIHTRTSPHRNSATTLSGTRTSALPILDWLECRHRVCRRVTRSLLLISAFIRNHRFDRHRRLRRTIRLWPDMLSHTTIRPCRQP